MRHKFWILPVLPLFFINILFIAGAIGVDSPLVTSNITTRESGLIFIVGILYTILFILALQRIFRMKKPRRQVSSVTADFASLLAFLFIAVGSLSLIFSLFTLIGAVAQVTLFEWFPPLILNYFSSLTIAILVLGTIGFVFFLSGLFLVIYIQGNPFHEERSIPSKAGLPSMTGRSIDPERPSLNPTITFKVLLPDRDEPVRDVKVILKQMNGTKSYTKYTDFSGEVTFRDVEGYGSEYYAYVEGDEKRERFRVFREGIPRKKV